MRSLLSLAAGTLLAALTFSIPDAQAAGAIPKYITAAVADTARPDPDRQADADRKPAESLAFAGIKPGQKVVDFLPGGGYFTRLFSAVVGPKGHVLAIAPPKRPDSTRDPAAAAQAIAADSHYNNVSVQVKPLAEFSTPEPVDLVWTSRNYHDLHNVPNFDIAAFDKAVFDALKPGGVFIVLDHAAEKGSGARDTSTLHRIDPEVVKKEVEAAGFKLEGESDVLHNPADTHTEKVFEGSLKGKTDQFILKFRKPK